MISDEKIWKAVANILKMQELKKRQLKLYDDMADTMILRVAYGLSMKGGVSFSIIDESDPRMSRVDNFGRGKGKYGTRTSRFPIRSIKGMVRIKHEGVIEIEDDLLDFHRKTRGRFLRG
jgi:hypothetical protein